jgi:hypothetical protein
MGDGGLGPGTGVALAILEENGMRPVCTEAWNASSVEKYVRRGDLEGVVDVSLE